MSDNEFTYIIRSNQKDLAADNTRSCSIKLNCSPQYRYFKCEVIGFYLGLKETVLSSALAVVDYHTNAIIELRAEDGLDFIFSSDTKSHSFNTLAFAVTNTTFQQAPHEFKVANFNNKTVKFSLYGDDGSLLTYNNYTSTGPVTSVVPYNKPWTLVIKMTGVNE